MITIYIDVSKIFVLINDYFIIDIFLKEKIFYLEHNHLKVKNN